MASHPEYAFICCDQDHGEPSSNVHQGLNHQHPFSLLPTFPMPEACTDESCSVEAFCCEDEHCSPILSDQPEEGCAECSKGLNGGGCSSGNGCGMLPPSHVCSTVNGVGICDDASCTLPQFPCSDEDCRFLDEYLRCCNANTNTQTPSSFTDISTQMIQKTHSGRPVHSRNILSPSSFDALLSVALGDNDDLPPPMMDPRSTYATPDLSAISSGVTTPSYGLGMIHGPSIAGQMSNFLPQHNLSSDATSYPLPMEQSQLAGASVQDFFRYNSASVSQRSTQLPQTASYSTRPAVRATPHICHWQNCHQAFESIPALLEHISKQHLEPDVPQSNPNVSLDNKFDFMNASQAPAMASGVGVGNQVFHFPVPEITSAVRSNPFSHKANGHLTCLWDDCLPVIGSSSAPQLEQTGPQETATQPILPHAHAHAQTPATLSEKPQQSRASLDSATAVLKHLLEQHLGLEGTRDLLNAAAGQLPSTQVNHQTFSAMPVYQSEQPTLPAMDPVWPEFTQAQVREWSHGSQQVNARRVAPSRQPLSFSQQYPAVQQASTHQHEANAEQAAPAPSLVTSAPRLKPLPAASSEEKVIHRCRWIGCSEVFADVVALTEHLSETHILKGKSEYQCLWDGCVICDCKDKSKPDAECEHGDGAAKVDVNENGDDLVKGRKFTSRQKIMRHLQSHTGYRPFLCHICQQNFSEQATLAAHIKRHTREKVYHCNHPGCEKSFSVESSLMIHKKTHEHKRSFVCTYCQKSFTEVSNLNKHIRTHTGERPFPCSIPDCGKRFARPDQQKRHLLTHSRDPRQRKGTGDTSSSPGDDDDGDVDMDMQ